MTVKYLIVGEVVFLLLSLMARRGHLDAPIGLMCVAAALSVIMWPLTVSIFVFTFFKTMIKT